MNCNENSNENNEKCSDEKNIGMCQDIKTGVPPMPGQPGAAKKTKVCIVGCSDSKNLVPVKDPSWEFWGVNNLFLTMPDAPWSRWFEIHDIKHDGVNFLRRGKYDFRGQPVTQYLKGIAGLKCPVYMQQQWPQIPNSIKYPLPEILNQFGNYFTNTISYEIALAIHLGFEEIAVYGVDMAVDTEYYHQRPSCEYFLGVAAGMGIRVTIPAEADLLKTRFLYGFNEHQESAWIKKVKSQIEGMRQRQAHAMKELEIAQKKVAQYVGAIAAATEQIKIWNGC